MRLNKAQFQQTEAAILHAFDRDALRRMLRRQLDEDLDVVAGDDELATVVFNLVTWAERNSRVSELIAGALAENSNNAGLKQLATDYRRWEAAPQSQQPAPAPPPVQQQPTPVHQTPAPPSPRRSVPGWILGLAGIVVVALITVLLVTNGGIPWSGSATSTPPTVSDAGSAQQPEPIDIPSSTSTPTPTTSEQNEETATAASSSTATPIDNPASDSDSPSLITNNVVNVRSGPGTSYQILETVDAGRTFPILAQTEAGDWYQILLNGTRGWINSALVTATNANNAEIVEIVSTAASATPVSAATTSTASPTLSSGGCIAGRSITNPASGQTIPRGYVTIEGEADLNAANG
ncbi:MAG: SH3 domain-containing protein, partial [Caldilineaceae bacterium]|nr:SH3 domain-containing protein [Caldilineaceae bacterium]